MTIREPIEPVGRVAATDEQKNNLRAEAGPLHENAAAMAVRRKYTNFLADRAAIRRGVPGVRRVGAILPDVIRQKVAVTESGKTRKVPAIKGMLRRLVNDALRDDAGAMKLLLSRVDPSLGTIKLADMLVEDRAILTQYLPRPDGRDPVFSTSSRPPDLSLKPDKEAAKAQR
jgi:hypothetical protein